MDGNGNTINDPIASAAGDVTIAEWSYNLSDTTWYKTSSDSGTSSSLDIVTTVNLGDHTITNSFESTTVLESGGAGSVFTLDFPTPPVDMQIVRATTHRAINALTFDTTDTSTIEGNPGGVVVAYDSWAWQYQASSDTWYRIR